MILRFYRTDQSHENTQNEKRDTKAMQDILKGLLCSFSKDYLFARTKFEWRRNYLHSGSSKKSDLENTRLLKVKSRNARKFEREK